MMRTVNELSYDEPYLAKKSTGNNSNDFKGGAQ